MATGRGTAMDNLPLIKNWARATIVPLVVVWVVFLIAFDIVSAALAPDPLPSNPIQEARCKTMPDGTQICDIKPPTIP